MDSKCAVESCDRPRMVKFDLCPWHRRRQREGRPLVGRKGTGGHNKKYTDDMTCEFPTCGRKPVTNNKCLAHDFQFRKHGEMWEINTRRMGRKVTDKVYAPERTCERCGETKTWNRFVLGTDNMKDVCRDCHRAALSERVEVTTNPKAPRAKKAGKSNMEELLDFLNSRTN